MISGARPTQTPTESAGKVASPELAGGKPSTPPTTDTRPPTHSSDESRARPTEASSTANTNVPEAPVTKCIGRWRLELEDDPNKEFILQGIESGFKLIDDGISPDPSVCENYRSTTREFRDLVETQIEAEIRQGRYICTDIPPPIISALGAIPKNN